MRHGFSASQEHLVLNVRSKRVMVFDESGMPILVKEESAGPRGCCSHGRCFPVSSRRGVAIPACSVLHFLRCLACTDLS